MWLNESMARNEDEDIEIPSGEDENVGDGSPKVKRERRRKSKEERVVERRVIFWTLLVILIITLGFWLVPRIGSIFRGEPIIIENENKDQAKPAIEKPASKNYVEITL